MCGGLEIGLGISPSPVAVGSDRAHPQGVMNPLAAPQGGANPATAVDMFSHQRAARPGATGSGDRPQMVTHMFHTCVYVLSVYPMHPYGSKKRVALYFTSEEGNIWKEVSSGAFPSKLLLSSIFGAHSIIP